jgi:hypothetical protein
MRGCGVGAVQAPKRRPPVPGCRGGRSPHAWQPAQALLRRLAGFPGPGLDDSFRVGYECSDYGREQPAVMLRAAARHSAVERAGRPVARPRSRPQPAPFLAAEGPFVVRFRPPTGGDVRRGLRAEIAQLVEHATENRGVASSNLALGTISLGGAPSGSGSVGRASPCQGEGRGFESRLPLHFLVRDLRWTHAAGPSSSGRTADFGSVNRGSNPRGPASIAGRRSQVV